MGLVACESAYEKGQEWLNKLRDYLLGNIRYVDNFLKERFSRRHLSSLVRL